MLQGYRGRGEQDACVSGDEESCQCAEQVEQDADAVPSVAGTVSAVCRSTIQELETGCQRRDDPNAVSPQVPIDIGELARNARSI